MGRSQPVHIPSPAQVLLRPQFLQLPLPPLQSDSSYDFLSAEEKACLLFLEETIGSLDTEIDSGLSTGESEQVTIP